MNVLRESLVNRILVVDDDGLALHPAGLLISAHAR